jgi:hypothetical protein
MRRCFPLQYFIQFSNTLSPPSIFKPRHTTTSTWKTFLHDLMLHGAQRPRRCYLHPRNATWEARLLRTWGHEREIIGSATGLGLRDLPFGSLLAVFGAFGRSKRGERVRHTILRRDTTFVLFCFVLLCKKPIQTIIMHGITSHRAYMAAIDDRHACLSRRQTLTPSPTPRPG